jgi:hypothetical protein
VWNDGRTNMRRVGKAVAQKSFAKFETQRATDSPWAVTGLYSTVFFACFFTFAHRFFAAFAIAALPAAERTRFFAPFTSTAAE